MKNCPVCGKKVKNNLTHCPQCGTSLYTNDQEVKTEKRAKVRVKKIHFDFHEFVIFGCIFVACFGLLIFKAIKKEYHDESSIISEMMVENYTFKKEVTEMDNRARLIDDLIVTSFKVGNHTFSDTVTSKRNQVTYLGDYDLKKQGKLTTEYVGNKKAGSCNFNLVYEINVNDFDEYETVINKLDDLFETIGDTVLTEHIGKEKYHESFMDYYQKHQNLAECNNDEDLGYVSISQCYAFVNFNEKDGQKSIRIEMSYDPCEVIYS